jgi:Ni/Co efflux regulator RcnB
MEAFIFHIKNTLRSCYMKPQMKKTISILIAVSMLAFSALIAQDKTTDKKSDTNYTKLNPDGSYSSTKHTEADRPEDSYLAKFHAQDVVSKLMQKNLEQVYLLKVIKTNFKDKGWDADYKKAYAGYKKGMELYYKRNIIYSRLELENNKKDIQKILEKVAKVYKIKL